MTQPLAASRWPLAEKKRAVSTKKPGAPRRARRAFFISDLSCGGRYLNSTSVTSTILSPPGVSMVTSSATLFPIRACAIGLL